MSPADGIRQLGFRRWYERQLIESHAYFLTCFLCMIMVQCRKCGNPWLIDLQGAANHPQQAKRSSARALQSSTPETYLRAAVNSAPDIHPFTKATSCPLANASTP